MKRVINLSELFKQQLQIVKPFILSQIKHMLKHEVICPVNLQNKFKAPKLKNPVTAVIEIGHGQLLKIESVKDVSNAETTALLLDRITNMEATHAYGYIPNTYEDDDDALDVIVLLPTRYLRYVFSGLEVELLPLFVVDVLDSNEPDSKIICLPKVFLPQWIYSYSETTLNNLAVEVMSRLLRLHAKGVGVTVLRTIKGCRAAIQHISDYRVRAVHTPMKYLSEVSSENQKLVSQYFKDVPEFLKNNLDVDEIPWDNNVYAKIHDYIFKLLEHVIDFDKNELKQVDTHTIQITAENDAYYSYNHNNKLIGVDEFLETCARGIDLCNGGEFSRVIVPHIYKNALFRGSRAECVKIATICLKKEGEYREEGVFIPHLFMSKYIDESERNVLIIDLLEMVWRPLFEGYTVYLEY